MSALHECPGKCGALVVRSMLACKPCWYRLPAEIRDQVNFTYRQRISNPMGHIRAVAEASSWYRNNPRKGGSA